MGGVKIGKKLLRLLLAAGQPAIESFRIEGLSVRRQA
jgi:hypothetical protein